VGRVQVAAGFSIGGEHLIIKCGRVFFLKSRKERSVKPVRKRRLVFPSTCTQSLRFVGF
jgi:hypothetical protein